MNELRFILLAIGILVILVIYLWETSRRKKQIRSRIDNYPSSDPKPEQKSLSPGEGRENQSDISAALKQISHYLRQSKPGANKSVAVESGNDDKKTDPAGSNKGDDDGQEIISLYIISNNPSGISGPDIGGGDRAGHVADGRGGPLRGSTGGPCGRLLGRGRPTRRRQPHGPKEPRARQQASPGSLLSRPHFFHPIAQFFIAACASWPETEGWNVRSWPPFT